MKNKEQELKKEIDKYKKEPRLDLDVNVHLSTLTKAELKGYKEAKKEVRNDLAEIYNNIEDDLHMAKNKEDGYTTHKEVVQAIKEHTLKVIKKKYKKYRGKEK